MHILHLNQRNQILSQYLRDKKKKKKGAQKKGGENSPISPPLDPRLPLLCCPQSQVMFHSLGKTLAKSVA